MRAVIALIVIIYLVGVWRRAVAHNSGQVEWRFGVKPRRKHRTGSAQRTCVAGRNLPQHDRPWLTAFDGTADAGFGRKEQRDKVGCESSPRAASPKISINRFNDLSRWLVLGPAPFTRRRTF